VAPKGCGQGGTGGCAGCLVKEQAHVEALMAGKATDAERRGSPLQQGSGRPSPENRCRARPRFCEWAALCRSTAEASPDPSSTATPVPRRECELGV